MYIYMFWLEKADHGPQVIGLCAKNRGVRFRIRDFKLYYFNSIPPTSHWRPLGLQAPEGLQRCRSSLIWSTNTTHYKVVIYLNNNNSFFVYKFVHKYLPPPSQAEPAIAVRDFFFRLGGGVWGLQGWRVSGLGVSESFTNLLRETNPLLIYSERQILY